MRGKSEKKYFCENDRCKVNGEPKDFKRASLLRQHELKVHAEKTLQCSTCPKKFSAKYFLKQHEETCTKEVQCDRCPCKFMYASSLKRHQKDVHSMTNSKRVKASDTLQGTVNIYPIQFVPVILQGVNAPKKFVNILPRPQDADVALASSSGRAGGHLSTIIVPTKSSETPAELSSSLDPSGEHQPFDITTHGSRPGTSGQKTSSRESTLIQPRAARVTGLQTSTGDLPSDTSSIVIETHENNRNIFQTTATSTEDFPDFGASLRHYQSSSSQAQFAQSTSAGTSTTDHFTQQTDEPSLLTSSGTQADFPQSTSAGTWTGDLPEFSLPEWTEVPQLTSSGTSTDIRTRPSSIATQTAPNLCDVGVGINEVFDDLEKLFSQAQTQTAAYQQYQNAETQTNKANLIDSDMQTYSLHLMDNVSDGSYYTDAASAATQTFGIQTRADSDEITKIAETQTLYDESYSGHQTHQTSEFSSVETQTIEQYLNSL